MKSLPTKPCAMTHSGYVCLTKFFLRDFQFYPAWYMKITCETLSDNFILFHLMMSKADATEENGTHRKGGIR